MKYSSFVTDLSHVVFWAEATHYAENVFFIFCLDGSSIRRIQVLIVQIVINDLYQLTMRYRVGGPTLGPPHYKYQTVVN